MSTNEQRQDALTKALDHWKGATDEVVMDYGNAMSGSQDWHLRVLHRPISSDRTELVIQRFFWTWDHWECSVDYQQEVVS